MARGNPRRSAGADSQRALRQFDLKLAALLVEEALATVKLQEWLSVYAIHDCLTGIDGLHNPLLFGAVNDSENCTRYKVEPAA